MARRRAARLSPAVFAVAAIVIGAGIALGVAAGTGLFADKSPPPAASEKSSTEPSGGARVPSPRVPSPRVSSRPASPKQAVTPPKTQVQTAQTLGRAAVVFDDAGGSLEDLDEIIALGRPVTVAVLPGLRFSAAVAERARSAGLEVILHLPLEADDPSKDVGPDGILVSMSDEEIERQVEAALQSVPGAIGLNNHMGSKGTADERVMRVILGVVKQRNLIFVDSVTSSHSVAGQIASEMGIRTATRQVFLDNVDEPAAIRAQVRRTIAIARRRGDAVAIGHAHRLTPKVLKQIVGEFDKAGIQLVPVSALTK